ncbi:MAG TPA: universal stress protein [Aggregatilineales bacterium]|nr:universal stress protein [Aggregatilineales bacterium]
MAYKNILVTLDGSELAEHALAYIPDLAAPGANVCLFSVVNADLISEMAKVGQVMGPTFTFVDSALREAPEENDQQEVAERHAYLRHVSAALKDRGLKVSTRVVVGSVVDLIVLEAERGYDVLVMATHCRTGLSRLALGSVAEAVTHRVGCPVLLIPTHRLEKVVEPHHSESSIRLASH